VLAVIVQTDRWTVTEFFTVLAVCRLAMNSQVSARDGRGNSVNGSGLLSSLWWISTDVGSCKKGRV